MPNYVIVSTDPANLTIVAGPILWDGQAPLTLPAGVKTLLADAATTAGYAYPAPPVAQTNATALQTAAANAIAGNVAYLASTPTAAQVSVQVKALTRQIDALIKLVLNQTDTTDGT